ncbi:MAG: carbon-nitrogen hydrolase family protein [Gemmatimonadaceae bacterium]|nr:carbon-nitrogen hydrolase family protein [Gemmatimonadaceae bacterium]
MALFRLALATLPYPATPEESVQRAIRALKDAGAAKTDLIVFPECYVPGYRRPDLTLPPPDQAFLEDAWRAIADAAGEARVGVVLGSERVGTDARPIPCAVVIDANGQLLGVQDKVQIPPEEEGTYVGGCDRQIFQLGDAVIGVVICHEGWRYPETVRWAARQGAQLVLHPHYSWHESGAFVPHTFGDPRNSFHEKAALCRAAENTCWFATVNYATPDAPTTSAVVDPDGVVQVWQPYGVEGLLVTDIDLSRATGLLAKRLRNTVGRDAPM